MRIGVQFYTLRDHCKTLEEFSESLKKVAEIGYKTVQIRIYCMMRYTAHRCSFL